MAGKINSGKLFETRDYKDSPLLKALESELGYTAAHSMLTHISTTLGKPKQEILSDYDKFAKIVTEIYGDAGEKHVLDKISNFK